MQNKRIGDKAEVIVINYYRKRGLKAKSAPYGKGYDVKVGNKFIEVKGTKQTIKQKQYFYLTRKEILCARKNKNFWIYWVDVKKKKIIKKINRNYLLRNVVRDVVFRVNLTQIKSKL